MPEEPNIDVEAALRHVVGRIKGTAAGTLDEERAFRVFAKRYTRSFQAMIEAGHWNRDREKLERVAALHGLVVVLLAAISGASPIEDATFERSCDAVQAACRDLLSGGGTDAAPRGQWCQYP